LEEVTSVSRFRRSPPSGTPILVRELLHVLRERDPLAALEVGLQRLVPNRKIALYASGREALRVAFRELALRSGRNEVVIPAYCCFSVPAAAVAAGLRVRLVDVGDDAQIDLDQLGQLPLERAAAIVVCNLFGIPEQTRPIVDLARAAGAAVIDDAAQSLGGRSAEGPVGGRGVVGVLSFGRGKPLSALGGGALAWEGDTADATAPDSFRPLRWRAIARALLHRVALSPFVFPWLAGVPQLGIGETVFDPEFTRGAIGGDSLVLAAALVSGVVPSGRKRAAAARELGKRVAGETGFRPLLAAPDCEGVYPRLALIAPDSVARERAILDLRELGSGASPMYPSALDEIEALRPHLAGGRGCENARDLSSRLLTIPLVEGGGHPPPSVLLEGLAALRREADGTAVGSNGKPHGETLR
jgi:dTDP-4-amino-4,6-dideoxygalactose transaminase